MSAYYKNRNKKEPQIKIGSKYENIEYSTKNIDPNLNYLNRQLYEEEHLSKCRKKRQLEEYSYYAKALENSRPPSEKFSKVNYDNLTGKIGQEKMEEEFYKYQQSRSKVESNAFAKPPQNKDMRSMNYHGYNIINNNILGFCDPAQKFPPTSYQQNYQPKQIQKEISNLTPSQYEDYQQFRRQQLELMEKEKQNNHQLQSQPQMSKEEKNAQLMQRELQREKEYLEKQRQLEIEQRKLDQMQRQYQTINTYSQANLGKPQYALTPDGNPYQGYPPEDYQRNINPNSLQSEIPPQYKEREPERQFPPKSPNEMPKESQAQSQEIPKDIPQQQVNQNEPNQVEQYKKAYEQYLLEQSNTIPQQESSQDMLNEEINKRPCSRARQNVPQPEDNPSTQVTDEQHRTYMEYMNKKSQEEMVQKQMGQPKTAPQEREPTQQELEERERYYKAQQQEQQEPEERERYYKAQKQAMEKMEPRELEEYKRQQYQEYLKSPEAQQEREEYQRYIEAQQRGQQIPKKLQEQREREEYQRYMEAQQRSQPTPKEIQEQREREEYQRYMETQQRSQPTPKNLQEQREREEYQRYMEAQQMQGQRGQPTPKNLQEERGREEYLNFLEAQQRQEQQQLTPNEKEQYLQYLRAQQSPKEQLQDSGIPQDSREREQYLQYLAAQRDQIEKDQQFLKNQQQGTPQQDNNTIPQDQDPEYLKKLKQYEEIVQGEQNGPKQEMNRINSSRRREYEMSQQQEYPPQNIPSLQKPTPSPYICYSSSSEIPPSIPNQNPPLNYHLARQQSLQGATPGKITKSNYIPSNPCNIFYLIFNRF